MWIDKDLRNKLRIIHVNLGHPSNSVLVRTLKDARASEELIAKSLKFECPPCAQRGHEGACKTA